MRSTKSIVLIVIAVGCGLIASIAISQVLENKPDRTAVPMDTIYVALTNVPLTEPLTAQHLKAEEWPRDKIPEGAIRSLEEIEGMRPSVPLFAGEPILRSKLSDGNAAGAAVRLPEGHRLVSVKVSMDGGASGLILPGDKVDVLVFIRGNDRQGVQTGTRTILRDVTVFAVGSRFDRMDEQENAIDAKTVSLVVKPDQAERLILAKQLGDLHLSLRRPGDKSTEDETSGASIEDLNSASMGDDYAGHINSAGKSQTSLTGIEKILSDLKSVRAPVSDTSIDATGHMSEMVILTPEGPQRFTWTQPGLPRELTGGSHEEPSVSGAAKSDAPPAQDKQLDKDIVDSPSGE